jgi:hypothetical protein
MKNLLIPSEEERNDKGKLSLYLFISLSLTEYLSFPRSLSFSLSLKNLLIPSEEGVRIREMKKVRLPNPNPLILIP